MRTLVTEGFFRVFQEADPSALRAPPLSGEADPSALRAPPLSGEADPSALGAPPLSGEADPSALRAPPLSGADPVSKVIDDAASNIPVFNVEECGSPIPSGNDDDDDDYYDNDENFGGRERIGKSKGKTPRNNQNQKEQFKEGTRGLTKDQKRRVHEKITKKGCGLDDIIEAAEDVVGKSLR